MISTVILTHNSRETLADTVRSVSWSDEVIVIDDYSMDGTERIAEKYSVHVFKRHLDGDFSAQRNYGSEKAQGEWILFIDSDERVSGELQNEIRETISRQGTHGEGIQGYFIKRNDIFFGRKLRFGETNNVLLLRLARKHAGIWKRPVHEYWDVQGATGKLRNPLIHTSHTDVAQFIKKINNYTTINAEYLFINNVRANALMIIFYPLAKFLWNYIFLLGFLDGTPGAVMAIMMSFHSFLTRAKLYMLSKNSNS